MTSHEESLEWADETVARLVAMPLEEAKLELNALAQRANAMEWSALLQGLDARQRSLSPRPTNLPRLAQWAATFRPA